MRFWRTTSYRSRSAHSNAGDGLGSCKGKPFSFSCLLSFLTALLVNNLEILPHMRHCTGVHAISYSLFHCMKGRNSRTTTSDDQQRRTSRQMCTESRRTMCGLRSSRSSMISRMAVGEMPSPSCA